MMRRSILYFLLATWLSCPELSAKQLPSLQSLLPQSPEQCTQQQSAIIQEACEQYAGWAAIQTEQIGDASSGRVLKLVLPLLDADVDAEAALKILLQLRTKFTDSPRGDPRRDRVRQYLAMCQQLIDLIGRLNYQQRDALDSATYVLASDLPRLHALIDKLTERRSSAGALMTGFILLDPDPKTGLKPYGPATRARVLRLMAAARSLDVTEDLAQFLRQRRVDPGLRLSAIEVFRHLGVPQDPHPLQDPSIDPPIITARELLKIAERTQLPAAAPKDAQTRRDALIQWLRQRTERGVTEDAYRVGNQEVRPGDWFLMRNPSPFNMFTDLTPGLFTHVGIVTTLTDDEGVRRFVVTDLPERGDRVPATNIDAYVGTTLHYVFLRHEREEVNRQMASAAADTIGNETQFDLLFRTKRVEQLKGRDLKNQRLHTYCAGYLLLCAQQTDSPRREFFPISEFPPSEQCQKNLSRLGVGLGDDYISPTGPLFSVHHQVVGGRKPLYSPIREIQARIFDHFGRSMADSVLDPSPDLFQSLRAKVAGLSRYNPWLSRALAAANNVSPHMDLKAAAQAAAVIETLDEVAHQARDEYLLVFQALLNTDKELAEQLSPTQLERVPELRRRHADLLRRAELGQITARAFRVELVNYYCQHGQQALNRRFFPSQLDKSSP